ncbi:MAG: DUF4838 domain-containing protein [Opitutales bacterium]|nr:DUF4838 domain-containing protein [Opitutales bacterium]
MRPRSQSLRPPISGLRLPLFALALLSLAVIDLVAHPTKRATAEQHRALMEARMPVERWFIPGELGYEGGKAPLPVGEGAFRVRSILRLDAGPLGEWGRRNQLTPWRGSLHNLADVFPVELFETHPEFFPLVEGERWRAPAESHPTPWQPDLAEPGVAAHAADYARRYFQENPEAWWVRLGTNDGLVFGDSAGVREWTYPPRWFRNKPDYSDLVFQFINRVAEAVSPDWPDRHFAQLAYYWTENTPSFPVHPKVVPNLSTDQSQLYDPHYREQEWALREAWGRKGTERLSMTHYLYGNGFLIPRQHLRMIAEHLRFSREVGFTDFGALAGFNWGLDGPQPWALTQLLLDPFQPLEPLLKEYYRRYFRAAAKPMRHFFEEAERIWREQPGPAYWLKHFRNESQAELFPSAVNRRLRALLDEAAARVRDDPVAAARVELTSAAFSVTEAFARFHEARQALSVALMERMEDTDPARLADLLKGYAAAGEGGGEAEVGGQRSEDGVLESRIHALAAGPEVGGQRSEVGGQRLFRSPISDHRSPTSGFLPTWHHVREHYPLAMARTNLDVYLMNDPGPTAAALLAERVGPGAVRHPASPDLSWDLAAGLSGGIELAGLAYRLDMPPGWSARVEPFQGAMADFRLREGIADEKAGVPPSGGPGGSSMDSEWRRSEVGDRRSEFGIQNSEFEIGPVLRLENQKRLEMWHWSAVPPDTVGLAAVEVRGGLSPSAFLLLRASWVDAGRNLIGEEAVVRLHEGDHPEWKPLRLFLDPPEGAAFLRYRLNAFHMMPGDWLEVREPTVEWYF